MAITCSWDKPLGTCYSKHDENREHPIIIWGGGNCLAVFTTINKSLQAFVVDKQHFKAMADILSEEFCDYTFFTSRKKESKDLINCFLSTNVDFTVMQSRHIERIE